MPSTITRARKNFSARRVKPNVTTPQPTRPILVAGFSGTGSVLEVEFDQAVSVVGLPAYTTSVAGATPVSVVQAAPHRIEITYSAAVAAATTLNVGFQDPA